MIFFATPRTTPWGSPIRRRMVFAICCTGVVVALSSSNVVVSAETTTPSNTNTVTNPVTKKSTVGIYESTTFLDLAWEDTSSTPGSDISLQTIYQIEKEACAYLDQLTRQYVANAIYQHELELEDQMTDAAAENVADTANDAADDQEVMQLSIITTSCSVTNQIRRNGITTLDSIIVRVEYVTNDEAYVIDDLDTILMELTRDDPDQFSVQLAPILGATAVHTMDVAFRPYEPSSQIMPLADYVVSEEYSCDRSNSERALVVATIMLSIMLAIVSSVLLYITGGWKKCRELCNACLFEELDDESSSSSDSYSGQSKPRTFRVTGTMSHDTADEEEDYFDHRSEQQSGVSTPGTNPSGMLGAQRPYNDDQQQAMASMMMSPDPNNNGNANNNPTAGFGINGTPQSDDDDTATTFAGVPMGITSMRKLQQQQRDDNDDQDDEDQNNNKTTDNDRSTGGASGGLANLVMPRWSLGGAVGQCK